MADNQYSRRHASRIEDLPKNDPLAELARIVGYDPEPALSGPKSDIDLESELLRELGVFDEPVESERRQPSRDDAVAGDSRPVELHDFRMPDAGEPRFADGAVEISLEDELLFDIEDGYRTDEAVGEPVEIENRVAPVETVEFPVVEAEERLGDPAADHNGPNADDASPEEFFKAAEEYPEEAYEASAWEGGSAEEFDSLARHEPVDETIDEGGSTVFEPPETYAADEIGAADEVEQEAFARQWDQPATPDADEDEGFARETVEALAVDQPEPAPAGEGGGDEELPFIPLSDPEPEADQQGTGSIDAFALEAELAAELNADADFDRVVSAEAFGAHAEQGEDFHPHQLFDPAPEAWREEDPTPDETAAARSDADDIFAGFDELETRKESELPAIRSTEAREHSSDDILADIERFDMTPTGEGAMPPVASVEPEPKEPAGEPAGPSSHDGAPDLDDWLRTMSLDAFGPRNQTAPEAMSGERDDANVIPLRPTVEEPLETARFEEPYADIDEDDFVGDDMVDLDAALEADLAAVHEEILSEAEIGRADEHGDIQALGTDDDERDDRETEGFFFPPVEAPAPASEDRLTASTDYPEEAEPSSSSPADLQAVASFEANGSDAYEFDPAALAEPDEPVELTPDLDIPDVAGEAEEPAVAAADDEFDLDMEADFAELLDKEQAEADAPAEPVDEERSTGIAAAAVAGGAAAAGGFAYAARQQPATVAPADVTFDYADMERSLDAGIAEGLTEDTGTFSPFDDEQPAAVSPAAPRGAMAFADRRRMMLAGGAVGLVVLAGVAVFAWGYAGTDGSGSDGPRIIAADTKPAKEKPADPGGKTVPNQNKVVYDSVDGTMSPKPSQKNLLTTAEKPVDVVQRTLDPDVLPLGQQPRDVSPSDGAAGEEAAAGNQTADAQKGQDRLAPEVQQDGAKATAPRGVEPHRVQTMVVTADGKLIPRDDGQQPPAADPSSGSAPSADKTNSASTASQLQPATPTQEAAPATTVAAPRPVPRPAETAADTAAVSTPAPAPAAATTPAEPAPVAEMAKAAPEAQAKPVDNPGGYFVQIASQPTEAGANASYKNLSSRYSSVIGGRGVDIQRADIAGKGVYYRVRVPAGSRQEAISLCENYRGAGGSCFVTQ